jgi:hypothetical protein
MKRISALSIQQPNAEQILRGKKKIEYRSRPTSKRERVYIYASKTPHTPQSWKEIGLSPDDLPTGVLVGTVEIVGCQYRRGEYQWRLARPKRLKRPLNQRSEVSGQRSEVSK